MSKISEKLKNNTSNLKYNFESSVKSTETIHIPIETQISLQKRIEQNRKEFILSRYNMDNDTYKENITNSKRLTLHK